MQLVVSNAGETAEFGVGLLAMTIVSFLILFGILSKFAIKPTMSALANREAQIKDAIESAKRERSEAEKLLAEQKTAIAQARQEAAEALRKTQVDMEKFREELMGKSRKEAEDLKVDARRAIEEERNKAVAELKAEAVKLSLQVAEKLLNEKLDDAKHQQLAQQFVTDLAGKKPSA
ncbi:MAG: F0F1 ATP synthase subunit B [Archangium sp.]|nr:F0F1 ATP synthase subunit B [Archangium sp.]